MNLGQASWVAGPVAEEQVNAVFVHQTDLGLDVDFAQRSHDVCGDLRADAGRLGQPAGVCSQAGTRGAEVLDQRARAQGAQTWDQLQGEQGTQLLVPLDGHRLSPEKLVKRAAGPSTRLFGSAG